MKPKAIRSSQDPCHLNVLATMLDEVLGCNRELGALQDNFERDREAVLDEDYR